MKPELKNLLDVLAKQNSYQYALLVVSTCGKSIRLETNKDGYSGMWLANIFKDCHKNHGCEVVIKYFNRETGEFRYEK